ncbi:MAG: hypothetical protein NT154_31175, partial [Verrucomicrobia bacterium]|nr:hypothetical protein [Verrucomicrobiota bacterium]
AVVALRNALDDESEMLVRPLAREALKKLEAKGTTTFSETNAGSPATYTGKPTKVAPLGVFPGTPQPITTVPLTNIDPRPTYTGQSTKAAPHAVALTANQISARGLEGEFIRKPGQYHLDDGRSILTITGLTSDSWSLKVTWRSEKRTATGGLEKTEASNAPPRCLRAKGWFVFVETPERIWVYDGLDSGTLLMHSEKEMGSAAFSPELMASCPQKVWNAFPKGFQENNRKYRKVEL